MGQEQGPGHDQEESTEGKKDLVKGKSQGIEGDGWKELCFAQLLHFAGTN